MTEHTDETQHWPLRSAVLATLGAAIGLAADAMLFESAGTAWQETQDVLRISAAVFLIVAGILFAVTAERTRWLWSAGFAVTGGIVVAAIFQWNGSPSGWQAGEQWHLVAAFLAIVLAAPLFQSARDTGGPRVDPAAFHHHAWANVILWFAAWGFVLIAFLLAHLLAALFALVGIDVLDRLMRESWFVATLVGAAFGAAVGLLRERDRLLATIQRAALAILSILAPVLALGLALFILALPFTGLAPLWEQTKATTPILLTCVIGAIVLANAVIGEEAENRRPLRIAAMGLAAVMLPLAIVAAISTGLRIDQHGLTPDRLWGLTFVVALTAIALAYAAALLRRKDFATRVNFANIRLATGLTLAALFLATPLAGFGALATRDQLTRLESGVVAPDKFDWLAMRFDFGPSGRAALERLAKSGSPDVQGYAAQALRATQRWRLAETTRVRQRSGELDRVIRVLPNPVAVPELLRREAASQIACESGSCVLFWRPGDTTAVAVGFRSASSPAHVALIQLRDGAWQASGPITDTMTPRVEDQEQIRIHQRAVAEGRVQLRTVQRRQVFIDGGPVGGVFE